jgi:kynurenine formamidase
VQRIATTKRNMATSTISTTLHYPSYSSAIPYTAASTSLQTLDLWLPRPLSQSDPNNTTWVIYIHGGAWRDPTQDSRCVHPTIKRLEQLHPGTVEKIAGIASINYRLSPYPNHATEPSKADDPERNVQHPHHIQDVCRAIDFLNKEYGVTRWIGVGHSCGATLILQCVAGIGLSKPCSTQPEALILLEGIYSIPLFLQNHQPPTCPENISRIYRDIIQGAFTDDSTYDAVSPVSGQYTDSACSGTRLVVLGHSAEDELVEAAQRDVMLNKLKREGWTDKDNNARSRVVKVKNLKGGHDEIWQNGLQIAEVINEVVSSLCNS